MNKKWDSGPFLDRGRFYKKMGGEDFYEKQRKENDKKWRESPPRGRKEYGLAEKNARRPLLTLDPPHKAGQNLSRTNLVKFPDAAPHQILNGLNPHDRRRHLGD